MSDPGLSDRPDLASSSRGYAGRFRGQVGQWFLDVQEAALREVLPDLPEGGKVLDVGGGHAQLAPWLTTEGCEVFVVGSAPSGFRLLRGRSRRIRFVASDLRVLPFPAAAFDAVICFRILAHIRRWRALVAELCRVSAGPVVVDYPALCSFNAAASYLFRLKNAVERRTTRPFRVLSSSELERAFRDGGYRITEKRGEFFWPMALHRLHGRVGLARALEAPARNAGLLSRFGSPMVVRAEPQG